MQVAHLGAQVFLELLQSLLPVIIVGCYLEKYALDHLVQLRRHRLQVGPACLAGQGTPVSFLERQGVQGTRMLE